MKISKMFVPTIAGLMVIAIAGCNGPGTPLLTHKLVATAGQTSIPLYPDEHTLIEVSHRSQQGVLLEWWGACRKASRRNR